MNYELDSQMYAGKHVEDKDKWEIKNNTISTNKYNNIFYYLCKYLCPQNFTS